MRNKCFALLFLLIAAFTMTIGLSSSGDFDFQYSYGVVTSYAGTDTPDGGGDSDETPSASDYDLDIGIEDGKLTGDLLDDDADLEETGNEIIDIIKIVVFFFMAGAALVLAIIFICHCVSLAANATNPNAKSVNIKALWITGLASALTGGVSLVMGLSFNIFR